MKTQHIFQQNYSRSMADNCTKHYECFTVKKYGNHDFCNFLFSAPANKLTWAHTSPHLDKKFIRWFDNTKRCCKTSWHTDHTQDIANTWCRLRGQAGQRSDTAQWRSQICHLMDIWIQSSLSCIAISTKECSCWKCVQVAVLRWVSYKHHKQCRLSVKRQKSTKHTLSTKAISYVGWTQQ